MGGIRIFLGWMNRLGVDLDRTAQSAEVLPLARRYQFTSCDAAYLELAQQNQVPLSRLDTNLGNAATAEGVPIMGEHPTCDRQV
jgi:predicted nucleic acid-binding protein